MKIIEKLSSYKKKNLYLAKAFSGRIIVATSNELEIGFEADRENPISDYKSITLCKLSHLFYGTGPVWESFENDELKEEVINKVWKKNRKVLSIIFN